MPDQVSRMTNSNQNQVHAQIAASVRERGCAGVARELGVHHSSLASYLASTCRAGTRALVEQNWAARRALDNATSPPPKRRHG